MIRRTLILLAAGAVLAGVTATAAAEARPRTGYIIVDPPEEPAAAIAARASDEPVVLYLNRGGGTYTPGGQGSGANQSPIIDAPSTIPPWNVPEAGWQDVVDCMGGMMARWNVVVTDQDPGVVPHYEIVIAGRPGDLGMPGNYGGVAPFSSQCSVIPAAVVYTFAEQFGSNYRAVCEVSAQEVAHAFGLDHEYLCEDPMSYLHGCGPKSFQPVDAACGEDAPRECACGDATQSSVAMLDARLGPAGEGNPPPDVEIMSPEDGARVPPGFVVTADVTDNAGVDRVDLLIDGAIVATAEGAPFELPTPADLAEGEHTIEVRAVDDAGASATSAIEVTVAAADDPGSSAGCSAATGPGALAPTLLLLLALLVRRRYADRPA